MTQLYVIVILFDLISKIGWCFTEESKLGSLLFISEYLL